MGVGQGGGIVNDLTGFRLTGKFRPHGAVQIEGQRQNAHKGTVAVVIGPCAAAFQRRSAFSVFGQCLPGGDAHIKDIAVGGHVSLPRPAQEASHHVIVVDAMSQALQQTQSHGGIVRPCPGRLMVGPVGPHPCHRGLFQLLTGLKLHRNTQGVACHKSKYGALYGMFKCHVFTLPHP